MRILIATLSLLLMLPFPAQAGDKALLGALIGAGAGAAIGHSVDRTGGSGKGAAIGAISGYVLGSALEKKDSKPADVSPPPARTAPAAKLARSPFRQDCALARDYFRRGYRATLVEDKIYYLQKGLQYCATDVRAHNDLGVAYYNRGGRHDRDRARDQFQAALRLDPGYTPARRNLNSL